jgi:thiol-disulfide isomerase/thioredoxin
LIFEVAKPLMRRGNRSQKRQGREAFFLVLAVIGLCVQSPAVLKKGSLLLPFSLRAVDERVITLRIEDGRLSLLSESEISGQKIARKSFPAAILLDFWATWCEPCRAAMPHLQAIYEKHRPKDGQAEGGLELFGVALDEEGAKVVKPVYLKLQTIYPMLADPTSGSPGDGLIRTAREMQKKYRVQEIPVVYLVDSQGIIRHVHVGFKKKFIAELESAVSGLISPPRQ